MERELQIGEKKGKLQEITTKIYLDYLDASEKMNENKKEGYKKEHIELMCEWIVKLYGNEFTVEELKDEMNAAGIIAEFTFIDIVIALEVEERIGEIIENFTNRK